MATSAPHRKRRWFLGVLLLVLATPAVVLAQQALLGGKFRAGNEVVIPAGERVSGDLYAAGGTVRIEGTVEGDLVASGGQVEVTGEVGGDLIASAGSIRISGQIGGDARTGAGQLTVSGSVSEDLLVGAGQLTISSTGEIGEDLVFGTGRTSLDGQVTGDVLGSTGDYDRQGTVGGTENVTVDRRDEAPSVSDRVLDGVRRFISLFAVGALLLWLVPRLTEGAAITLRRRPLPSLAFGLLGIVGLALAVIAVVVAMIVLLLFFGWLGLGDLAGLTAFAGVAALVLLSFLMYLIFAFVAHVVVAMAVGRVVFGEERAPQRFGALALGLLVVVLLSSLPVVGGWIGLVVLLLGVGAIVLELSSMRRARRTPTPPPPTAPAAEGRVSESP